MTENPELLCLSLTYRDIPIETLERANREPVSASDLAKRSGAREAVVLATCNRFEAYLLTTDRPAAEAAVAATTGARAENFQVFTGESAVRHLFRVAASLESMVVGENQILHQIRRAEEAAARTNALGPYLRRLFVEARRTGRIIRSRTTLGEGSLSIASIARDLARKIFQNLDELQVLVLGTGEIGLVAGRYFAEAGARVVHASRRGESETAAARARFGAAYVSIAALESAIADAQIVIAASGAKEFIVTADLVQMRRKKTAGPLLMIDLSIPRNIDPACETLRGVYLYAIPDFDALAIEHGRRRANQIDSASAIIDERLPVWRRREISFEAQQEILLLYRALARWESTALGRFEEAARPEIRAGLRRFVHRLRSGLAVQEPLKRGLNRAMIRTLFHGE